MDCWIGIVNEGDRRIIRLAGRLTDSQVPDLLEACAHAGLLKLDLTDLISADAAGIDLLRRIRNRGALLVGTPGYIQLKLEMRPAEQRSR